MGLRSSSCLLPLLLLVLLVPVSRVAGVCPQTDSCTNQPNCTGCIYGDMVPDPANCHGFYYCVGDEADDYSPTPEVCASDLQVFDPATGECVLGTCEQCDPICVYECDDSTSPRRISSPDDCTVYYECDTTTGDILSSESCTDDAAPFFDGISCQAAETRCCRCYPHCDTDSGATIIDPLDCRKYWYCQMPGTIPTISATCPDGENFDPTFEECSATIHCIRQCTNAVGEDGCIEPFTCLSTGYFAKCPQQCTQEYYHCEEATGDYLDAITCPTGAVFHPDSHICVDPDDCPY